MVGERIGGVSPESVDQPGIIVGCGYPVDFLQGGLRRAFHSRVGCDFSQFIVGSAPCYIDFNDFYNKICFLLK